MSISEEKVIELSKTKVFLLLLGSIIFVVLGVWILSIDAQEIENSRKYNSPTIVYGVGISAIAFFGLSGIIGIKKLFDTSPGLVLSVEGILDNSSGLSAGIIPWSEIVDISEHQIQKQKLISVHVKDPEKYANKGNMLKRTANRANINMVGTPINISANSLKIDHKDLLSTMNEYFKNCRSNALEGLKSDHR